MEDPNHLSSQNHSSNSPANSSRDNLINLFRNLLSSETVSIQEHDQGTTIPSYASGLGTYSIHNPNAEFTGIQPDIIGLLGQAPILPVRMETQQLRAYSLEEFGSHYFPQQFNRPRSPYGVGLGLNAPIGLVDQTNDHSFISPDSFVANPFSQNNQPIMYPLSAGQNPFITEDCNEGEIQDLLHNISGGVWKDYWSMQTILNHPRLDSDDPTLLFELREIGIVLLAKCPKGSQYLQNILESKDVLGTRKIFQAFIGSDIVDLMEDKFGNHVLGKLLEYWKSEHMEELVLRLTTQKDALYRASINKHGTIFVQKLIRTAKKSSSLLNIITEALAPRLLDLMTDKTGSHVIQACLDHLDCRQNYILYEVAVNKCIYLATHEQGCLSLNKCINCITDPQRRTLLQTIVENSIFLAQDPYGNYVVQHVLQKQHPYVTINICQKLQECYVELSMQKSGSHVVEKCINSAGIVYVLNDLVKSERLVQVAKDPFGNYVIQTALKATKGSDCDLYQSIVTALQPHLPELQSHPNGRNVYNLIKGIPIKKTKKAYSD